MRRRAARRRARSGTSIDGVPYPVQYIVKDGDRMFRIAYQIYGGVPAPAGATKDKVEAILSSFKFVP